MNNIIGHALVFIAPCQLRSFFALLYNMVKYEDLIHSKPKDKYFKQKLKWETGTITTCYLPPLKAPSSCVTFWIKKLQMYDRDDIKCFDDDGYSSLTELVAEMKGLYLFYSTARYVIMFHYISLCFIMFHYISLHFNINFFVY